LLAVIQLLDLYCEKGDGAFLGAFIVNIDRQGISVNVDRGDGWREEVEEVAQGGSEGETVPDCIHRLSGDADRASRGGEGKKLGKTMDTEET
jgi:hypothetical protein